MNHRGGRRALPRLGWASSCRVFRSQAALRLGVAPRLTTSTGQSAAWTIECETLPSSAPVRLRDRGSRPRSDRPGAGGRVRGSARPDGPWRTSASISTPISAACATASSIAAHAPSTSASTRRSCKASPIPGAVPAGRRRLRSSHRWRGPARCHFRWRRGCPRSRRWQSPVDSCESGFVASSPPPSVLGLSGQLLSKCSANGGRSRPRTF